MLAENPLGKPLAIVVVDGPRQRLARGFHIPIQEVRGHCQGVHELQILPVTHQNQLRHVVAAAVPPAARTAAGSVVTLMSRAYQYQAIPDVLSGSARRLS